VILLFATVALAADPTDPSPTAAPACDDEAARLAVAHRLDADAEARIRAIFEASPQMGSGLPGPTRHPMTPEECRARRDAAGAVDRDPAFEAICGRPYMAPLYDPATGRPEDATACIDQYEFPGFPCAYPIIWVRASEAAQLCSAMGKRLCDAHEWEGGCDGALLPPDYRFDLAAGRDAASGQRAMRAAHNAAWSPKQRWAYGDAFQRGVCAQASTKNDACDGSNARLCGSNTYPTGSFPGCRSPLGVYDQHGNAAEHMNLPLSEAQMASRGSEQLGVTEMKGSWFIWDTYRAHEDWCRWRAPYWHGGPVMASDSHKNYHLSFRCCADVPARTPAPAP
jgi:hypothetical protein